MARNFLKTKQSLPVLGVGLGLRRELANDTFAHSSQIDWLEFVPENYMELGGLAKQRLDAAVSQFPLVSHGVNLSIGSTDELNYDYLRALKAVVEYTNSPWFSDHLCFTSVDGKYLHDLLPMPFTREAVHHVAERIKRVQDFIARPFLLENISFYMHLPGSEMGDADFMSAILEEADCGLLLDINNVYVNAQNHQGDPFAYLQNIPLERVVQMHVAGHKEIGDYVIDTHGEATPEPVFDLLAWVLRRTPVNAVLLERDQNFPPFEELLRELEQIRKIASENQPALARVERKESRQALKTVDAADVKGGRDLRAISA